MFSLRTTVRAAALAAALTCSLVPAAHAGTAATVEPILTLEGQSQTCTPGTGLNLGLRPVVKNPSAWWRSLGVQPLTDQLVQAWTVSPSGGPYTGYDQCTISTGNAAQRLYNKLLAFRSEMQAAYPQLNITKVDVASISYGTTVSRYCIKLIAGCAQLVDDWVGIVPPSHGTTLFASIDCNFVTWKPACQASKPNGSIVQTMNAGDETPNGSNEGGWIDYTTVRATADGVIYPAGTEALAGAANYRVVAPNSATTHSDWGGPIADCNGSTAPGYENARGILEAIAGELLDVTPRSTWLPNATSTYDANFACNTDTTVAPPA